MKRTAFFLGALCGLLPAFGALAQGPRYFPLEAGNRWIYWDKAAVEQEVPEEARTFLSMTVVEKQGGVAWVHKEFVVPKPFRRVAESYDLYLREVEDRIEIEIPGEGWWLYYDFSAECFFHRDVEPCREQTEVCSWEGGRVETPVGVFDEALALGWRTFNCADGGILGESFAPGVGMVLAFEETGFGPVFWVLGRFTRVPLGFVRGDANASGSVAIEDPVFLLWYLFRGGPEPPCLDAADADDSGVLELTDAVYVLGWLFRGTAPPPPPGPTRASEYPREDCGPEDPQLGSLGCDAFPPCREEG